MLTTAEQIDFLEAIEAQGLSTEDFEATEGNESRPRAGIHPVRFTIAVMRKSTGVAVTYRSGFQSDWHVQFKRDLAKTRFG